MNNPERINILGVTGSIGDSALRVIAAHPQRFALAAITAQENAQKLIAIAQQFRPQAVAIGNEAHQPAVREALVPLGITVLGGAPGIREAAAVAADLTLAAIVGAAGLDPLMTAIAHSRRIAIATKEALVCAGPLVKATCARHGTMLLPVDSEHNAIFQVLGDAHRPALEKLTLTASGGPFLTTPLEALAHVTVAQALAHPRWRMGEKISVDSATMMNKGLELIEAQMLFDVPPAQLAVLIHPQSVVHALVQFRDGSVLAQLGMPDMAIPIAYCLGWPERLAAPTPRLDLSQMDSLTFLAPDEARFPALGLARAAMASGPAAMIALNAANEVAVEAFLRHEISFTAITQTVAETLQRAAGGGIGSLEDVLAADAQARRQTRAILKSAA